MLLWLVWPLLLETSTSLHLSFMLCVEGTASKWSKRNDTKRNEDFSNSRTKLTSTHKDNSLGSTFASWQSRALSMSLCTACVQTIQVCNNVLLLCHLRTHHTSLPIQSNKQHGVTLHTDTHAHIHLKCTRTSTRNTPDTHIARHCSLASCFRLGCHGRLRKTVHERMRRKWLKHARTRTSQAHRTRHNTPRWHVHCANY